MNELKLIGRIGLIVIALFVFVFNSEAALIRVDFNGTTDGTGGSSGVYSGFFTYDDNGLNLNGFNINRDPGYEISLSLFDGARLLFDQTTASVDTLQYSAGNLVSWAMGGDLGGPGGIGVTTTPDFLLNTAFGFNRFQLQPTSVVGINIPQFTITQLANPVSTPASLLLFIPGILGLWFSSRHRTIAIKREVKMKINCGYKTILAALTLCFTMQAQAALFKIEIEGFANESSAFYNFNTGENFLIEAIYDDQAPIFNGDLGPSYLLQSLIVNGLSFSNTFANIAILNDFPVFDQFTIPTGDFADFFVILPTDDDGVYIDMGFSTSTFPDNSLSSLPLANGAAISPFTLLPRDNDGEIDVTYSSVSITAVPAPPTIAILLAGFAALFLTRKSTKHYV